MRCYRGESKNISLNSALGICPDNRNISSASSAGGDGGGYALVTIVISGEAQKLIC